MKKRKKNENKWSKYKYTHSGESQIKIDKKLKKKKCWQRDSIEFVVRILSSV